ncbi:hypothetical protein M9458_039963, partial [Cirrhinus mrigala]
RTNDTYQRNDHGERFQDCDYPKYFADFGTDYYEGGRRGRWNDTTLVRALIRSVPSSETSGAQHGSS